MAESEDWDKAWKAAEKAAEKAEGGKARGKEKEPEPAAQAEPVDAPADPAAPEDKPAPVAAKPEPGKDQEVPNADPEKPKKDPAKAKQDDPAAQDAEPEPNPSPEEPTKEDEAALEERRKKFFAEAKELGYEVPEGAIREVKLGERIAFKKKMAEEKAKLRTEFEQRRQEIETREAQFKERSEKVEKLRTAVESGNLDDIAKELGFGDWRSVNQHFFEQMQSPQSKEIALLKRQAEEREKRDREMAEKQKAEALERRKAELLAEHQEDVIDALKTMKGGKYSAFANNPMFVQTVITHQKQHWDGSDTIGIEEAVEYATGSAYTVYQELHKLFGSPGGQNTEGRPAREAEAGTGRVPKTISRSKAAETARHAPQDMDDQSWSNYWASRM